MKGFIEKELKSSNSFKSDSEMSKHGTKLTFSREILFYTGCSNQNCQHIKIIPLFKKEEKGRGRGRGGKYYC